MNYNELLAENNRNVQRVINLEEYVKICQADALRMFLETLTEVGFCSKQEVINQLKASIEMLEEKGES